MKRKKQIKNINWKLPSSIIETIFSKLPFYTLPRCRIVCKEWNDLISTSKFDPQISIYNLFFDFIRGNLACVEYDPKHLNIIASFNFCPYLFSRLIDFSIVNSCNGLFCLLIEKFSTHCSICILNPMTNEYLELPISKAEQKKSYDYRLGFSPKTKQYKLVRSSVILHDIRGIGTAIEILSFGTTREWIAVDFLPCFCCSSDFIYFNGGLYLVMDGKTSVIYRLDLEGEKIKKISYPINKGLFHQIVELNGALYLTLRLLDCDFHVWKMREDFSWIKAFVFSGSKRSVQFNLLKAYEDGKILCGYRDFGFDLILYQYDPISQRREICANQIETIMSFHQVGSPSFSSLSKILVGKG